MLNLPKIQALIAPLSAPIPSALAIAADAYSAVAPQTHVFFGWLAAIAAFAGIETVGGASCYALVKLHRQRQYGIEFLVALIGVCIYIGSGLYTLQGNPTIIFFFLAPFAYFAYSILRSMETEIEQKTIETEAQIKLVEAQKRLVNAETRRVKLEKEPARASMSQHEPAPREYMCQLCQQEFGSTQALNAHRRFCKGVSNDNS